MNCSRLWRLARMLFGGADTAACINAAEARPTPNETSMASRIQLLDNREHGQDTEIKLVAIARPADRQSYHASSAQPLPRSWGFKHLMWTCRAFSIGHTMPRIVDEEPCQGWPSTIVALRYSGRRTETLLETGETHRGEHGKPVPRIPRWNKAHDNCALFRTTPIIRHHIEHSPQADRETQGASASSLNHDSTLSWPSSVLSSPYRPARNVARWLAPAMETPSVKRPPADSALVTISG